MWIPPQQQSAKQYVRYMTITSFTVLMLYLTSVFYDEYKNAEIEKAHAINTIVAKVEENNIKIEEHNTKAEKHNEQIKKQVKKKKVIVKLPEEVTRPIIIERSIDRVERAEPIIRQTEPSFPKIMSEGTESSIPRPMPAPAMIPPPPPTQPKICADWREAAMGKCVPPAKKDSTEPKKPQTVTVEVEEKQAPIEKQSKIEIDAGLVKIAMSNEASWMAIFKIVFTLLATFFGVKLINFVFKRLESEPKIA